MLTNVLICSTLARSFIYAQSYFVKLRKAFLKALHAMRSFLKDYPKLCEHCMLREAFANFFVQHSYRIYVLCKAFAKLPEALANFSLQHTVDQILNAFTHLMHPSTLLKPPFIQQDQYNYTLHPRLAIKYYETNSYEQEYNDEQFVDIVLTL